MNRRISGIFGVVVALCLCVVSFAACNCCSTQSVSQEQKDAILDAEYATIRSIDMFRAKAFISSNKSVLNDKDTSFTDLRNLYNESEKLINCVISRNALMGDGYGLVSDFQSEIVKKMMTKASSVDECSAVGKGIREKMILDYPGNNVFYQRYIGLCKTLKDYMTFLTTTRIGGDDLPKFRIMALNKILEMSPSLNEMTWLTVASKTVGMEPERSAIFADCLKKLHDYKASPEDFKKAYDLYTCIFPEKWDWSKSERYFLSGRSEDNNVLESLFLQNDSVTQVLCARAK